MLRATEEENFRRPTAFATRPSQSGVRETRVLLNGRVCTLRRYHRFVIKATAGSSGLSPNPVQLNSRDTGRGRNDHQACDNGV